MCKTVNIVLTSHDDLVSVTVLIYMHHVLDMSQRPRESGLTLRKLKAAMFRVSCLQILAL